MSIIGSDLDSIDRKQQKHLLVTKKVFLTDLQGSGKVLQKFCRFDANYGLTMCFFRDTNEEEDFDYFYTIDLRNVKEKITLVLRTSPTKNSKYNTNRQFLLCVKIKFSKKSRNCMQKRI